MVDKTFRKAFENGKNMHVAAVITYTAQPREKKTGGGLLVAENLTDMFNALAAAKNPLVRRKMWVNYDGADTDRELIKRIGTVLDDKDEIRQAYNDLERENGPDGAFFDGMKNGQDEIKKLVDTKIPPVIELDFKSAADPENLIDTSVPFERLRRELRRLHGALDRSARGQIDSVTIVHIPFTAKTLSKEQLDALLKPR